ncbi:MAG: hypothetical protein MK213_05025 [Planctomycetes bacterium]|nr:hypothetical protein [Planctomycetota bacterium]
MGIPPIYLAAIGSPVEYLALWQTFVFMGVVFANALKTNTRPIFRTTLSDQWAQLLLFLIGGSLLFGVFKGNDTSALVKAIYVIATPILVYFLFRALPISRSEFRGSLGLFAASSIPLAVYGFFLLPDRFTVESAAISGSLSHIGILWALLPSNRRGYAARVFVFILCISDVYFSGTRRFLLPVMVSVLAFLFLTNTRMKWLPYTLAFGALIATILVSNPESTVNLFDRGIGYRNTEFNVVKSHSIEQNPWLGTGMGGQTEELLLGSKGFTIAGPRFHNFYLTLIFNGGLLLFFMYTTWLLLLAWKSFSKLRKENGPGNPDLPLWGFFFTWIFVAAFDSPRDGLWILGMFPAYFLSLPKQNSPKALHT